MTRYSMELKNGDFYAIHSDPANARPRKKKPAETAENKERKDERQLVFKCDGTWYCLRCDGCTKKIRQWFFHKKARIDGFSLRLEHRDGRRYIKILDLGDIFSRPWHVHELKGARIIGSFSRMKDAPEDPRITYAYIE